MEWIWEMNYHITVILFIADIPENGVDMGNELPHNYYSVYRRIVSLKKGGEFIG